MACDLTLGRLLPCLDTVSGIDAIYFINYGDADGIVYDAEGVITNLGTSVTAYKYELKGVNSFNQTIESSRDNGTTFFTQNLAVFLQKQDATTSKEVKMMAYGRPQIVVEYRDGNAVLAGELRGMELGGEIQMGAQMGDPQGYQLNFVGMENCYARFLTGAVNGDPFGGMTDPVTVVEGT